MLEARSVRSQLVASELCSFEGWILPRTIPGLVPILLLSSCYRRLSWCQRGLPTVQPVTSHSAAVHLWAQSGFLFSLSSHWAAATDVRSPLSLLFPRLNSPLPSTSPCLPCAPILAITGTFQWTHSYMTVCPLLGAQTWGEHTRSGFTSIWEESLQGFWWSWCSSGLGAAVFHGCTPAFWPCFIPLWSESPFCKPAPCWLAPARPTAGLCLSQSPRFALASFQWNMRGSHQPISPACPIYKASLPSSTLSVTLKHSKHTVQSFIQKALMKVWNWTSPVVTSWGILFLTSHQLDLVLTSPPLEPGTAANFPPISFHTQPISHLFACKESIWDLEKGFAKAKVYNTCYPPLFHTEVHVIVEDNQGGWPEFALGTSLWLSYS